MARPRPALVVFLGGLGGSPVEKMVAGARAAAARDSVQAALAGGRFTGAVLVTDGSMHLPDLPAGVTVDVDPGPFHFGCRLAETVRKHDLGHVVYLGGGSLPRAQRRGITAWRALFARRRASPPGNCHAP
ncbi:hypothetical protein LCGC14_1838280 [marine sediment metagenome]|uniref:Uncharacterized protein n=1 Tax=marine sediment metagenome TaxID=412755 RepID=A0A0F9GE36_9ZZZZ